MTRVVCQQLSPRVGEPESNRALASTAIAAAAGAGADLVVLPELATSGYVFASAAEAETAAIGAADPLFEEWAAAAGGAVVVAGFCERGDDGRLYDSAAVLDGAGLLGVYRKTHLWNAEKRFFAPGAERPRVFDTKAGRIGVLVCYDLEFPELPRALALAGAELLAVPVNWPLVPRPAGERPPEVLIAQAAARVNRVCVACCDRSGSERGQEWTAGTTLIGADGWIAASQAGGGAASADLDLAAAREKRIGADADALGDRRPELYGELTEGSG